MISNLPKPTTILNNTTRIGGAELWSTITTTWATEPRTWLATISLFGNLPKPVTAGGTIESGIKYMGHIMQYSEDVVITGTTMNNLPKP